MKCIDQNIAPLEPKYPLEKICNSDKALFIDIETTGLHSNSSNLYLIGCVYKNMEDQNWHTKQWFAENYDEEKLILQEFCNFASSFESFIHFNGNQFDIPYLIQKAKQYRIPFAFKAYSGIDIYRRILPYKHFLKLTDCRQKTIEDFVHTTREDTYSGEELIDLYHDYVFSKDSQKEYFLLLHNEEDLKGMLDIIASLAVTDLVNQPVKVTKVHANYYKDIKNQRFPELIISLKLSTALPTEISYGANGCYFTGFENTGKLRVPLFEEEMKYFYDNYKEYYYLPKEDIAIHKSVASFVDKDYREPAHAYNCYTRKKASYLPQWDVLFAPVFKRDYKDKEIFFELTDEFKTQRESFNMYASHVLMMLTNTKINNED